MYDVHCQQKPATPHTQGRQTVKKLWKTSTFILMYNLAYFVS